MKNVGEIFTALGGLTAVSRIIGRGVSTVSEMKRRGNIPVEYWPALVAAASDEAIAAADKRARFSLTNDMLVDAHIAKATRAAASIEGQAA
jgi:hypothetical protein